MYCVLLTKVTAIFLTWHYTSAGKLNFTGFHVTLLLYYLFAVEQYLIILGDSKLKWGTKQSSGFCFCIFPLVHHVICLSSHWLASVSLFRGQMCHVVLIISSRSQALALESESAGHQSLLQLGASVLNSHFSRWFDSQRRISPVTSALSECRDVQQMLQKPDLKSAWSDQGSKRTQGAEIRSAESIRMDFRRVTGHLELKFKPITSYIYSEKII